MEMQCHKCLHDMVATTTTYYSQVNNCRVVIENVPCFTCPDCGHVVYTIQTMAKIEMIEDSINKIMATLCVFDYNTAA